ncbi:hypothetical protein [Nostoc sp.]
MGTGYWGLGIGDWVLGTGEEILLRFGWRTNNLHSNLPQSLVPNP